MTTTYRLHGRTGEPASRIDTYTEPCGCHITVETALIDLGQGDTWEDPCWAHGDPDTRPLAGPFLADGRFTTPAPVTDPWGPDAPGADWPTDSPF